MIIAQIIGEGNTDPPHDTNREAALALARCYTLPFGRHRGQRLDSVPHSYVEWLARACRSQPARYYAGLLTAKSRVTSGTSREEGSA